ncbi:MAG: polyprenyl synthetase family protein [Muribaculaceae bacterium]|nr:polyprenyl synthetase family protein [Muribaculaceae bacterium]MDE6332191.1 polyprenyl synthetase family protein [Muribaculaceae bacterium]
MSTLEAIQNEIAPELARLKQLISEQLSSSNELMNQVIENYLQSKGKLIRPIIVMLSARLFGPVSESVLSAAAAVELLHNASLIHDDVVDEAKTRRNRPTINSVWDNHIAVLVGDFFVSSAMQQAIATGDIRIIDSLCHLGKLLSLGEIDQIFNARYHTLTEDAYFKIINYKTASLFVACAKMGCYASGIDDERLECLARFAELLGLCFQMRDDIFDYYDSDLVGKPTGNDLREGKITLPLLSVLLRADAPCHDEMVELSRKEELSEPEISILMKYARDNGGIDYCYQCMNRLRDEAMELLGRFPESRARQLLAELFDFIITRKY